MRSPTLQRFPAPQNGRLSKDMIEAFRRDGVIILTDFVSLAACQTLKERALKLVDEFDASQVKHIFSAMKQTQVGDTYFEESGDKIRFFFEHDAFDETGELKQPKVDSLNKMGHAMHDLDPVFDTFSRTPELSGVANSLSYDDPLLLQSMYVFKPPRIGGEVYCHQDSTFLYTEPESTTGFWFALEDATTENGCMHFIPGAHKGPLKKLHQRAPDGKLTFTTLDDTPWPEEATLPAEAKAGTLVIFDGRAPHQSGPNRSAYSRHAYTLHIIDKNAHYPAGNYLQRGPDLPFRGFAD